MTFWKLWDTLWGLVISVLGVEWETKGEQPQDR